jgi:hypothetical protein
MTLTFLGIAVCEYSAGGACFFGARQLDEDALVAAVDTLRILELLNLVRADEDVMALEVVDMELRQEWVELALEAGCCLSRSLRVLTGEILRRSMLRSIYLFDDVACSEGWIQSVL